MSGGCILMNLKTTNPTTSSASRLIGRYCFSTFAYFNPKTTKYEYKKRPILVIGVEKEFLPCDITVLPISKISNVHNIDDTYDYKLTRKDFPKCSLGYDPSYVRTHKITTIHSKDLSVNGIECQFDEEYPSEYEGIKKLVKQFTETLFTK